MILARTRRGLCVAGLALSLGLAGALSALPARPAGADTESFFAGPSPCPIAHCNQHLDGREGLANNTGSILALPVSTPPLTYTTFTPSPIAAFTAGLGCTVGELSPQSVPDLVACSMTAASGGSSQGPFLYNLTASGITATTALTLNWASAPYTGPQHHPCATGSPFAVDKNVYEGAPLFSDLGYTYVSDDKSIAKFNPTGSGGVGTCAWGHVNPAGVAMISWNAVYLPPNGGSGGYPGGYFLVGQGTAGPVLLEGYYDALLKNQLLLPDPQGGLDVTYNTVSVVETATGVRVYDSTAQCSGGGGCSPLAAVPGRLYAIDITSPTTASGTPQMTVAYSYTMQGPSGASVMVLPAASGAPVGDQVYFDGSGPQCASPCSQPEHPTLFGLRDNCPFGSTTCATGSYSPTLLFANDFTQMFGSSANGYCPRKTSGTFYDGIQAAPALEGPETGGPNRDYSVWEFATCGSTLYRFDAQTGQPWNGSGASSINIPTVTGLPGYYPSSTMNTVVDTHTGHTTMFVGAEQAPPSQNSYLLALDLETGGAFWEVLGPTNVGDSTDTPFNGQFPIAQTAQGGNVLIATTAGNVDGGRILAIPLS